MTEYNDQPRTLSLRGELDAADLRGYDAVTRHTDHAQVAQTRGEDDLHRHPRVGAAGDGRKRFLPGHELARRRSWLKTVSRLRTPPA